MPAVTRGCLPRWAIAARVGGALGILLGLWSSLLPGSWALAQGAPEDGLAMLRQQARDQWRQQRWSDAERSYRRLIDMARRQSGEQDAQLRSDRLALADLYFETERYAEAEGEYAALEEGPVPAGVSPAYLMTRRAEALLYTGRPDEGLKQARLARGLLLRADPRDGAMRVMAGKLESLAQSALGRDDEALATLEETLEESQSALGSDHPLTRSLAQLLPDLLFNAGRMADAESLARQRLADSERQHGSGAPETEREINRLARILKEKGRVGEAVAWYEKVLDGAAASGLSDDAQVAAHFELALIQEELGQMERAADLLGRAVRMNEALFGPDHPETLTLQQHLGWLQVERGQKDEAENTFAAVLYRRSRVLGLAHPKTQDSRLALSALRLAAGRPEGAEPLLLDGWHHWQEAGGQDARLGADILERLVEVLSRQGRRDAAIQALRRLIPLREDVHGPYHTLVLDSLRQLAELLVQGEQWREAWAVLADLASRRTSPDMSPQEEELWALVRPHMDHPPQPPGQVDDVKR
ncbi:MAG: tetratricopeptide repeat protein [Magnetococcus sp. WYHC-3]